MYLFLEKGTRGGIFYISNIYSKANNKYLKYYDPKKESKHFKYLDANNLYGYVMSKFFPTSEFKWIDPKEIDLNKYSSNSSKAYFQIADFQIADLYNTPIGNVKKLVPNFFDKEKYVLHYENLQIFLRLGLKLKKIYCVLEFNQTRWLKPYIEFNTQKRIETEKNKDKECYIWKNNGKLKK